MIVMPSNNSSSIIHYWAGKYENCPRKIGWLVGPNAMTKTTLRPWIPFACDNDAFSAWVHKTPWCEESWLNMLCRIKKSGLNPLWILVPDVVADKEATLKKWSIYSPIAKSFGWPLAFAVQDGMTPDDVPDECLIFVGGTTEWKWDTVPMWAATGRRVHVGRVNSIEKVVLCENLGVESVDGTGWMRGTIEGRQGKDLELQGC
jgi:hypothetical protein